jgi:hypothetical protein
MAIADYAAATLTLASSPFPHALARPPRPPRAPVGRVTTPLPAFRGRCHVTVEGGGQSRPTATATTSPRSFRRSKAPLSDDGQQDRHESQPCPGRAPEMSPAMICLNAAPAIASSHRARVLSWRRATSPGATPCAALLPVALVWHRPRGDGFATPAPACRRRRRALFGDGRQSFGSTISPRSSRSLPPDPGPAAGCDGAGQGRPSGNGHRHPAAALCGAATDNLARTGPARFPARPMRRLFGAGEQLREAVSADAFLTLMPAGAGTVSWPKRHSSASPATRCRGRGAWHTRLCGRRLVEAWATIERSVRWAAGDQRPAIAAGATTTWPSRNGRGDRGALVTTVRPTCRPPGRRSPRTAQRALQADGVRVVWGDNSYGQTNQPPVKQR